MKLAAVVYETGQANAVDALLTATADRLRGEGYRLAGAVQHNTVQPAGPCADMIVEDLASGRRIDISTPVSPGAAGCRLDAAALEDVAGLVAAALDQRVDLLLVNRFGKQEAMGKGFRSVIETAVAREIPVLLTLNADHLVMWESFTGGFGVILAPDLAAIDLWCRTVLNAGSCTTGHAAGAPTGA